MPKQLSQKEQLALISKQRKEPTDYKKVNKTRRQRGYSFEYDIVQAFNNHTSKEWYAKRLGGSSTGLPDVVVTNNDKSILYAIECKSGDTDRFYVPSDQIERCKDITDKFLKAYKKRYVVLAFKFKGNKSKRRKLQYRIIIFNILDNISNKEFKGLLCDLKFESIHGNSIIEEWGNPSDSDIILLYNTLPSINNFVNWSPV